MTLINSDVIASCRAWRLWTTWAWLDILQRYRRSLIGPFWTSISMAMTIGGMGVVFGVLFRQDLRQFFPYLAAGMIIWQLISVTVTESCMIFLLNEKMIRQFNLPLSLYAQRHTAKQFIVFAHHLVIFIFVAAIFGTNINAYTLLAPFGLAIIFVNGVAFALLVGTLCARFRDIQPIIANITQLVFYVTPVLWKPELLGSHAYLAEFNPLYHFIEVVRRPLLGEAPTLVNYGVVLSVTLIIVSTALWFFSRFRHRVAFWL